MASQRSKEAVDALARYTENSSTPQRLRPPATNRQKHLGDLERTLCTIAKDLKLANPELQARAIRKALVCRIDYYRSWIARNWRYGRFIEPWNRETKRSDAWLCYIIRLTILKRKISQRRGSKSIGNRASARKEAIKQASTIKTRDQLFPIEQRAFDLLKGDRRKSDMHPIERRAIQLVMSSLH
jgi:hypothetical protein